MKWSRLELPAGHRWSDRACTDDFPVKEICRLLDEGILEFWSDGQGDYRFQPTPEFAASSDPFASIALEAPRRAKAGRH